MLVCTVWDRKPAENTQLFCFSFQDDNDGLDEGGWRGARGRIANVIGPCIQLLRLLKGGQTVGWTIHNHPRLSVSQAEFMPLCSSLMFRIGSLAHLSPPRIIRHSRGC